MTATFRPDETGVSLVHHMGVLYVLTTRRLYWLDEAEGLRPVAVIEDDEPAAESVVVEGEKGGF